MLDCMIRQTSTQTSCLTSLTDYNHSIRNRVGICILCPGLYNLVLGYLTWPDVWSFKNRENGLGRSNRLGLIDKAERMSLSDQIPRVLCQSFLGCFKTRSNCAAQAQIWHTPFSLPRAGESSAPLFLTGLLEAGLRHRKQEMQAWKDKCNLFASWEN